MFADGQVTSGSEAPAVLLMRHGETDWNREPARCQGWSQVGLNERGRAQARAQGQVLRVAGLRLIVSSHLVRARETAELIAGELDDDVRVVVDPRLAETHRGDWEARLFRDIINEEPETWRHYREHPETFRFPGGESLVEQQERVLAALHDVVQSHLPSLVVTHGGSIRLVRCLLKGGGIETFHDGVVQHCATNGVPGDDLMGGLRRLQIA